MSVSVSSKQVVFTVFLSLVLDLLAFTIPLPLFPRLIAWYLHNEAHDPSTLLSRSLQLSHTFRSKLLTFSSSPISSLLNKSATPGSETRWMHTAVSGAGAEPGGARNWDVVLLGGGMGSLFSLCQCLISPWLGSLSDKYGRKKVLLFTMLGNILSAIIWAQSTSFTSFLVSRLVAGLSEGNVQLSTAIISDVTDSSNRSKSLALVGIAFSICFTLGPSLGAYFASRPFPMTTDETSWNVYALPAAVSLGLLLAETVYLAINLPETKGWKVERGKEKASDEKSSSKQEEVEPAEERLKRLNIIGWVHGIFLLFFSGAEFTLTFLTYDLFSATNAQNGRLLSYIGILAAFLQARHVRPSLARLGELRIACFGCYAAVFAFICLTILPLVPVETSSRGLAMGVLYAAATGLGYTSATVVTALNAAAAACCDDEGGRAELQRGRAMGVMRSKGQLGRAIGPLLACSIYWLQGPTVCYAVLALFMTQLSSGMMYLAGQEIDRRQKVKSR